MLTIPIVGFLPGADERVTLLERLPSLGSEVGLFSDPQPVHQAFAE